MAPRHPVDIGMIPAPTEAPVRQDDPRADVPAITVRRTPVPALRSRRIETRTGPAHLEVIARAAATAEAVDAHPVAAVVPVEAAALPAAAVGLVEAEALHRAAVPVVHAPRVEAAGAARRP